MSVVLTSRARPQLSAPDVDEHEPRELTAEAETYEAALEQLRTQLPEEWVLLGISRDTDA